MSRKHYGPFGLPDAIIFRLKGRVYSVKVILFVHPHNRVDYRVTGLDGNFSVDPRTNEPLKTLRSFEIHVAFLNVLRKEFNQEYMEFMHS
jgi:hypothetical protein